MRTVVARLSRACAALAVGALAVPAFSPAISLAGGVVGNGSLSTCTEAALDGALAGGGNVTFNCGNLPFTIAVTAGKAIAVDTSLDGGGLLTLSGERIRSESLAFFWVNQSVSFGVRNLIFSTFNNGTDGGFLVNSGGTLTVTNSTFSGAAGGSAIFNNGSVGTLSVSNSTFSHNSTIFNCDGGCGGAITNGGGTVAVTNSTFSGNRAPDGGAILNDSNTPFIVTNSTFSDNGGGGGTIGGLPVTLTNTIVANSTFGSRNCSLTMIDGGHNLDSDGTCGVGPATDPGLDPAGLAYNGGPTQTIALRMGSLAINAGDESICEAAPVNNRDQRSYARPGTGATNCSTGAYEYRSPGPPPCCQCPASCAVPVNGSCGSCRLIVGATCENGDLCVLNTPTPIPPPTPTPTKTPGVNDCCQCANLCAAPIVGTCGGCTVVFGASCTGSMCTLRTSCVGDCDGNGEVTVDELVTMVNIDLGTTPLSACTTGDADHSGGITVDEIIAAVDNTLGGCF